MNRKKDRNEKWNQTRILFDKLSNTIVFPVLSKAILPTFLHYLLEYHKLPQDAILVFLDRKVKLVKNDKNEFIYEEIESYDK